MLGVPFWRAVSIHDERAFRDHVERCVDGREQLVLDVRARVPGRGRLLVRASSAPVPGSGPRQVWCGTVLADVTTLDCTERGLRFLVAVDEALIEGSLDPRGVLDATVAACVPALGDACFVDLVGDAAPPRRVRAVALAGADAAVLDRQGRDETWQRYELRLLQTLSPLFEPASAAGLGAPYDVLLGAHALLVLPLVARGCTLGALGTIMTSSRRTYSLQDLELAWNLADHVAASLAAAVSQRRIRCGP